MAARYLKSVCLLHRFMACQWHGTPGSTAKCSRGTTPGDMGRGWHVDLVFHLCAFQKREPHVPQPLPGGLCGFSFGCTAGMPNRTAVLGGGSKCVFEEGAGTHVRPGISCPPAAGTQPQLTHGRGQRYPVFQ